MLSIISHSGNRPYVGHFQGKSVTGFVDIVSEYTKRVVNVIPEVSIITAFNNKEESLLALQLEASNISYDNACTNKEKTWSNIDKIKYYLEALMKTTSEYSLLLDGNDVLLFKDIDEEFINKYKGLNKKILFNATKNNYPNFQIGNITNDELGEYKYLNAGVVFGKTSDLKEFYQEALNLTLREDIMNPWGSEQLYIKMCSIEKEYVGFDSQCILFQTFYNTSKTVCGSSVIII